MDFARCCHRWHLTLGLLFQSLEEEAGFENNLQGEIAEAQKCDG